MTQKGLICHKTKQPTDKLYHLLTIIVSGNTSLFKQFGWIPWVKKVINIIEVGRDLHGLVVNMLDSNNKESKFKLKSNYLTFWTNTLREGTNPCIFPPAMG